jgi:ADP-heptose:LPS heptosyltransferase
VLEAPAPWYDPRRDALPAPFDLLPASASLRRSGYDWGFDLRGDPRVILFYLLPAARRRFGFSGLGLGGLLSDALPYDRRRSMLDLCLDLTTAAGAPPVRRRPVFRPDDANRDRAGRILEEAGIPPGAPFAVVAPGANRPPARWAPERFAAVCDGLEAVGLRMVAVGRIEDRPVIRSVGSAARRAPADLSGRTSLSELAALLERAQMLLGNDSGPSHLAAAVDCPAVIVLGPTDPVLTFPYEDGVRYVGHAAPIDHPRPCFDAACSSDHGFSRIRSEEVLASCLRIVGRAEHAGDSKP